MKEIIALLFFVLGIGGWIANVVKLIGSDFDPLTGLVVVRAIGVFFALIGAILGFV